MDEQLEHALEGAGAETALHEKTDVPPADRKINEEADKEAKTESLQQVNTESPTEEVEKTPNVGLSSTEERPAVEKESLVGDEDNTSPTTNVVPPPPLRGLGLWPLPLEGRVSEGRDYYAEWQELAEAHPEVVGKELPEDIYQACMQSDLPPLRVYESMMLQKQNEQIVALQQEIATLRQNAENTARAPVVAAAEGPTNEPESLFMKGFYSY